MPRDLIFLSLSLFTWGMGESTFLAFQPLYLQELGADPVKIGAILSAYWLTGSLTHIPAGYLSDRIGRRPLMWAAWLIGSLSTWIMALAGSLPWFVAGLVLYGSTMFVMAPLNSYISAARGKWPLGCTLSLDSACYSAGAILGPSLGGFIAQTYDFRSSFLFAAVVFLASTLFMTFIRPQPRDLSHAEEGGVRSLANARLVVFLGIAFFAVFAAHMPQPLAPNFLQNQRLLTPTQIGSLYTLNNVGVVALNLGLGYFSPRLGILVGQVCVGLFSLLLWRTIGMPWFGLGYFMLGGYRVVRVMSTAHIRSLVPASRVGLAYGLTESAFSLAAILASFLAGLIYARNPTAIFPASIVAILLSLAAGAAALFPRPASRALAPAFTEADPPPGS
jgi:MFS family permease